MTDRLVIKLPCRFKGERRDGIIALLHLHFREVEGRLQHTAGRAGFKPPKRDADGQER
ncbi:hypothetical protein SDC9_131053 [bioreactor metagenome]|uniref:Uncharacterized protein n=1 Tax=bioreactor metagenome TaxID=1076179 RepID=A0A645D4L4_9ZZZZ